jgi:hypothetical protein
MTPEEWSAKVLAETPTTPLSEDDARAVRDLLFHTPIPPRESSCPDEPTSR